MLKNYLKIAIRNLTRFKTYSAINVLGLAVGMAGCMLIFLYVQNEFSFDKNNWNASRIYRVIMERKTPESVFWLIDCKVFFGSVRICFPARSLMLS